MNIKKGDTVKIISGKDRGKTGKVIKMLQERGRVSVEGINLYKKNVHPKRQGEKGEVITLARPLHLSNVQIVCSNCSKAVRTGNKMDGEKKVRYCRNCKSIL